MLSWTKLTPLAMTEVRREAAESSLPKMIWDNLLSQSRLELLENS